MLLTAPVSSRPSSRDSQVSGSSAGCSEGIRTGMAPAPSTTARTYFSPVARNGCGPISLRSVGSPTSGVRAMRAASDGVPATYPGRFIFTTRGRTQPHHRGARPPPALSILDDLAAVTLVPSRRGPAMTAPSTSAIPAGDLATLQALEGAADAHVDLLLPDANGVLRGKRVPASALGKVYANGVCLPMSLVAADILGNTVEETGLGYDIGDEDRICRPIPGSLRPVPWSARPALQLLLQMEDGDGGWFEAHPRRVLQRVLDRFAAAGLTPVLAVELEFYLFDRLPDAEGRPQPTVNRSTGRRNESTPVYSIDDLDEHADFLHAVARACRA